mgnify:CR=1 FL=1
MANQIGMIKAILGSVVATATGGTQRNLQLSDTVYSDEIISTAANGAIEIGFSDGSIMDLGRNSQALLDNDDSPQQNAQQVSRDSYVDEFQQTLLEGADPSQTSEATAAASTTQSDGNEGADIVQVFYEQQFVQPTSGFSTSAVVLTDSLENSNTIPDITLSNQQGNSQPIASDVSGGGDCKTISL